MSGLNSTDPSSYRDSSGHIISPYYGYLPTRSVCMMFVALFGISTLTHVVQAIWTRKWWLLYTICLAGSGEILGWSGRLWSSYSTLNQTPYTIHLFMVEYYFRYIHDRPVRSSGADLPSSFVPAREPVGLRMKWMVRGLCTSTFFLFVRSIYRTIELADGFGGRIIKTQVYFSLFDGAMVLLAIWTLNFMHPGFLLGPRPTVETIVMQDKRDGSSV
ncbi:hypothetical protein A0H81_01079 [Grifola frondosa]|uniref:Protein RTA1 n=1 Tax=Grifola frondosa TaxID=5627 RepID=A0A1C7MRJ4_GRIFR|nr:hypothetical protein A0H81_01079 [Grifola frondosa]